MRVFIYAFILFAISSCANINLRINEGHDVDTELTINQNIEIDSVEQYSYDTLLSQGFHLAYRVYIDSARQEQIQKLSLVKEKEVIKVLNETTYLELHKSLGYIGADFGETFLFTKSFGSGNPHQIQLIEKETGKELLSGVWVDVNESEKIILYIMNLHEENEELKLLDLANNKEFIVQEFRDSKCINEQIGGLRNCVVIDTVTFKEIVLKIDSDEEDYSRTFKR